MERNLTLKEAVETATAAELADKTSKKWQSDESMTVGKVATGPFPAEDKIQCGDTNHGTKESRFRVCLSEMSKARSRCSGL